MFMAAVLGTLDGERFGEAGMTTAGGRSKAAEVVRRLTITRETVCYKLMFWRCYQCERILGRVCTFIPAESEELTCSSRRR